MEKKKNEYPRRTREVAGWVEALVTKLDNLSPIIEAHIMVRTNGHKLSSDPTQQATLRFERHLSPNRGIRKD